MMNKSQILFFLLVGLPLWADGQDLVQQGDSCMEAYDTFHALRFYEAAFEADGSVRNRHKLAHCHYRRQDFGKCIDLLKFLKDDSITHEGLRELFYSYRFLDNSAAQIYWGEHLLKRYPMDAEMVAEVARTYNQAMQPDKALIHTMKYSLKDSTDIAVNRQMGDACFLNKQYQLASEIYSRLAAQGDSTYSVCYSLGICYQQLKKPDRALPWLSRAVAIRDSTKTGPLYYLGYANNDLKQPEEAIRCLKKAESLLEPEPALMFYVTRGLAESYFQQGRFQQASSAFKDALRYDPGSITSYYYLAYCYQQMGDREKAVHNYNLFMVMARAIERKTADLKELMDYAQSYLSCLRGG